MKPILLQVIAATAIFPASTAQSRVSGMECIHENATVRLTGTVEYRNFYGPPNYGENPKTDRLLHVPLLRLDKPITPCELTEFDSGKAKVGKPVRMLQLSGAITRLTAGQRQRFVGTVHPATMGPEFLDYIFDVR